jgi:hypothetical protein
MHMLCGDALDKSVIASDVMNIWCCLQLNCLWVVMLFAFYVAFSFLCLLSFVMQYLSTIYLAYLFLFMHNLSRTELPFSAWSEHKFMLSSSISVTCSYFSELRSFRFHIVSLVCYVKRLQKYLSRSMLLFYLKLDLSTTQCHFHAWSEHKFILVIIYLCYLLLLLWINITLVNLRFHIMT